LQTKQKTYTNIYIYIYVYLCLYTCIYQKCRCASALCHHKHEIQYFYPCCCISNVWFEWI